MRLRSASQATELAISDCPLEKDSKDRDKNAHGYMSFDVLFSENVGWRGKLVYALRTTFRGRWTLKLSGRQYPLWDINSGRSILGFSRDTAYEGLNEYRAYRGITRPRNERGRFLECEDDEPPRPPPELSFKIWRHWFDGALSAHAYFVLLLIAALCKRHGRAYEREVREHSKFALSRLKRSLKELTAAELVERFAKDEYRLKCIGFIAEKDGTGERGSGKTGTGVGAKPGTGFSGTILREPLHGLRPLSMDSPSPEEDSSVVPSSPNGDQGPTAISSWDEALSNPLLAGWIYRVDLNNAMELALPSDEFVIALSQIGEAMTDDELLSWLFELTGRKAARHITSSAGLSVVRALAAKVLEVGDAIEISNTSAARIALGIVLQAIFDRVGARGDGMSSFEVIGTRILSQLYEDPSASRFYKGGPPAILNHVVSGPIFKAALALLPCLPFEFESLSIDLRVDLQRGIDRLIEDFGLASVDRIVSEIERQRLMGRGVGLMPEEICGILEISIQMGACDETGSRGISEIRHSSDLASR